MSKYLKAFTMVELLIVIGIMVIMAGIGGGSYFALRDRERIDQMANRIVGDMRATIARTQAQENGQQWGIHFDNVVSTAPFYAIWYGASYAGGTTVQKVTFVTTGLMFTAPASGASTDMVFTKPYGLPSAAASVTIGSTALTTATARTISIDTNGNITY